MRQKTLVITLVIALGYFLMGDVTSFLKAISQLSGVIPA